MLKRERKIMTYAEFFNVRTLINEITAKSIASVVAEIIQKVFSDLGAYN